MAFLFSIFLSLVLVIFSIWVFEFYKKANDKNIIQSIDQQIINFVNAIDDNIIDSGSIDSEIIQIKNQSIKLWQNIYISNWKGVIFNNINEDFDIQKIIQSKNTNNNIIYKNENYIYSVIKKWWYIICININIDNFNKNIQSLLYILIFLSIFVSLASYFVIHKLVSYFINPLSDFTKHISQINNNTNNFINNKNVLTQDIYNTWDEIQTLSETFDKLMSNIYNSINREKEFIQNISHELRTPITGIKTTLELISTQKNMSDEDYDILLFSSNRMEKLVNSFLSLAKSQTTTKSINNKITIDISKSIDDIIKLHINQADQKNIYIKKIIKNNFEIKVNEESYNMVINNIISNSVSYTSKWWISITIDKSKIIITDTWAGISIDHQDKIWDRLYRWDQSRSTEWFGLWLSIVDNICKSEWRKINFESEVWIWTSFIINFN